MTDPELDALAKGLTEKIGGPPILVSDNRPFAHHLKTGGSISRTRRAHLEGTRDDK